MVCAQDFSKAENFSRISPCTQFSAKGGEKHIDDQKAIKKTPTSKLAVIFMQYQLKQIMLSSKMSSPLTSKNCIICLMPG